MMPLRHRDPDTGDHTLRLEQLSYRSAIEADRPYLNDEGLRESEQQTAARAMGAKLLKDGYIIERPERIDGDERGFRQRIREWYLYAIRPGDDDSMWFVRELSRARREGLAQGLKWAADEHVALAERFAKTAGGCAAVLRDSHNAAAKKLREMANEQ